MLRGIDSLPSTETIIQDPQMEPYFITKSPKAGYAVYERVIKGDNKKEYIDCIGYFSSFSYCLKRVIREQVHSGPDAPKSFSSMEEYLTRWEEITKRMEKLVDF